MLKLIFFENYRIPVSWKTVVVGRKLKFADQSFVEDYATKYLTESNNFKNIDIIELAYGVKDDFLIDILIKKIVEKLNVPIEEDSQEWDQEIRKWRFLLLSEILNKNYTNRKILAEIESIYCDFDHPENMIPFIPYMPYPEDTYDFVNHTPDENREHLINLFYQFLEKEKNDLQNKT